MKLYLRFGSFPKSKKSTIYRNGIKIGKEKGVSVFELHEINGFYRLIFPVYIKSDIIINHDLTPEAYSNDFADLWCQFIGGERDAYLVKGREVCKGADGEPILKDIKIIKKLISPKTVGR